ncbi:MAG: cysteine desulfurase NifS [Pseudodesulfovibrio sp.]
MQTIYLDTNATTRLDPAVFEAMIPYFTERYGNPSSSYGFGARVKADLDRARTQVATLLGCGPDEIIFTSCGSESDNAAIRAALAACPGKRHIVTTAVEHPAVLKLCTHLEAREGCPVTYLAVDRQGRLDPRALGKALRDDTAVVSVMWANNETGNVHPIAEMAATARERGVLFHTDAVQAVGKLPIDLAAAPVDMLSLSGHKLHAPKGIGALFVRRGTPFAPLIIGGGQESGRRAGTENTAAIVGLGKACELAMERMAEEGACLSQLRDRLESGLLEAVPDTIVNGDPGERLPNTTYLSFGSVSAADILRELDRHGICASSGSACCSSHAKPSHVLTAMETPLRFAHGSIRFSLGRFNGPQDVEQVLALLPGIIATLRASYSHG